MLVEIIQPMGGANRSYSIGEKIEIADLIALRLIDASAAIPTNKKEYDSVLKKIEKENNKIELENKRLAAITERDNLTKEKEKLLKRVAYIDDILNIEKSSK